MMEDERILGTGVLPPGIEIKTVYSLSLMLITLVRRNAICQSVAEV